jgi:O-methyltransferase domain
MREIYMHVSAVAKVPDVVSNGQLDSRAPAMLWEMANIYWLPRCLYTVAEIGVADHIATTPVSAAQLAKSCEANDDALFRVMRALSSHGIFEHTAEGFAHTPLSLLLRSDHPQSLRAFLRMIGMPAIWSCFLHMEHVVRTGEMGALRVDPEGLFHYFQQNPHEGALFNDAMEAKARATIPAVLKAYDFTRFSSVADVGGGKGHLLRAILDSAPGTRGILFDQPHVVATVSGSERIRVVGGNFFSGDIPDSDLYILMEVIHDWNDEQARQILKSVRQGAEPGSRLLIIENVMPECSQAHPANALDIIMLVLTGGRERTEEEHAALLESAGFSLASLVTTESSYSILEAVAI